MHFKKPYQYWMLAAVSGVLLVFSFPSFNLFPLAWFSLVPLLTSLRFAPNWKSAFWRGYLCGAIFFLGLLYWIVLLYPFASIFLTLPAYLLLVGYLSLYPGVFAGLLFASPWQTGLLFVFSAAAIWTGLEWVSSWMLTGFPWGSIGYTQWKNLPAIQIASVTGVHGVTFLVLLCNATIAEVIHQYQHRRLRLSWTILPVGLAVVCLGYGVFVLPKSSVDASETAKIALVPGNVNQLEKWDRCYLPQIFGRYISLIESADADNPDVIILPETAIPGAIFSSQNGYRQQLEKLLRERQIYLLTGIPHYTPDGKAYNSVFLIAPDGAQLGSYAKMHLVPFGEYVPINERLPNFVQLPSGFEPGKSLSLFPVPGAENAQMGVAICFESVFPNLFRKFVKEGADVMGILTNDAWFVGTSAPEQHLMMAPFRAVENRVSVFRCANGGLSCIIDKFGRVVSPVISPDDTDSILVEQISLKGDNRTLYTRYGDWFPILCFIWAALVVCGRLVSKTRSKAIVL